MEQKKTMKQSTKTLNLSFEPIKNVKELGCMIRAFRKSQQLTLDKVSGITHIGMRFLSELERGKETAEIGKTINIINKLGLELIIQPRGQSLLNKQTIQDKKEK